MKIFLFSFLLIFLCGCNDDYLIINSTPQYSIGDSVIIGDCNNIPVIITDYRYVSCKDSRWVYNILLSNGIKKEIRESQIFSLYQESPWKINKTNVPTLAPPQSIIHPEKTSINFDKCKL